MTWSFFVFLLATVFPNEVRGCFCVAAQHVAEVHACVHEVHSMLWQESPSLPQDPLCNLTTLAVAASTKRKGPSTDEMLSGETGARRVRNLYSSAPRAGAGAFLSGWKLEPPSPEPPWEGSKNQDVPPRTQNVTTTQFRSISLLPDPRGLNQEGTTPPLPPTSRLPPPPPYL